MWVSITRGLAALLMLLGAAAQAVVPRFEPIGEPGAVRDNVVSALALDARGLIWAGSPEGLLRFDGYVFRRYPLSGPDGQMRCHFRLMRPGSGMAGGGQGRCQLPSGTMIDATFPPT